MTPDEPETIIRPCQSQDLPEVLALLRQLDEVTVSKTQLDLDHLQKMFSEMESTPRFYYNLVCETAGRVSGFLSMIFYRTPFHTGGTALINELVIDREHRRRNLGQMLISQAIAEARVRGMNEIEVGTEKSNQEAQEFYKKAGFDEEFVSLGMDF